MQQRPPARARADDDDVEMLVHDGSWSGKEAKPYRHAGKFEHSTFNAEQRMKHHDVSERIIDSPSLLSYEIAHESKR
jgi:hypothetical protein